MSIEPINTNKKGVSARVRLDATDADNEHVMEPQGEIDYGRDRKDQAYV
jgi:hypothetical protein